MNIYKDLSDLQLAKDLQNGRVGVLPTDTVYGIVCQAASHEAVERLYKLKSREKKPGTIVAASIDQLVELGLKRRYLNAVEQYWPGAVSIIIPTSDPDTEYLTQGVGGLAVRVVDAPKLVKLLEKVGPLVTSSANQPGEPTSTTIDEAQAYFGDRLDFCVEGGDRADEKPSTLIRVVDDTVEVLREGAVEIKEND